MQDFRVQSGIRANGNITGVNYLNASNITVTYTGSFANIFVSGKITGNVVGTVSSLDNQTTSSLKEGSNLYFTAQRAIAALAGNNVTVNNLTVSGDLEVQGNVVSVNTATLNIEDKNILLANGAINASQADGAGITIAGANASIVYENATNQFAINKNLEAEANLIVGGTLNVTGNTNLQNPAFINNDPVITLNPLNQSIALLRSYMDAPVGNVIFVSGNGNDKNSGNSLANALANIHTALNRAQPWTTVFVKSGDYFLYEQPVTIKTRVGMVGDNLRTTTIRPTQPTVDMFYVNNACYVTGITFRDHRSPAAAFSFNPNGSAGTIITSPYIQNCSSITTTGTGMRVDGNYVTGLRSMVCDSYTNTNEGGIGIHMLNRGYTQLVSVFTICCDIAVLCENGGFCSITNSNASFGRLGLKASGVSHPVNFGKFVEAVDTDEGTKYLFANLNSRPNYGDAVLFANYDQAQCSRDTGLVVDSLAFDLAYQSNTQSAFAGLQYWSQSTSAIQNQATETIAAFSYAKNLATNVAVNATITSPRQANVTQSVSTIGVTNAGSGAYVINSVSNPSLTLQRGVSYRLQVSASGHPFWIKTVAVTGTGSAYSTGVTNNGTESGTIVFNVPLNAPDTLYYICQYHGGMVGTLNIVNAQFNINAISNNFDLVANIITDGTVGISDRIISNGFPANTNVNVNDSANLILSNKSFIQKEVIAFVNQTYPGFFANASNYIDAANAISKCERDTGYLLDSVVFDYLHGGNRQSVTSGVYYYNNDFTATQIENQVPQTTAAYDFIGTIIDDIIKNKKVAGYNQEKCERDTGLIVDSLAFDLGYNSNTQSNFAGLQYWSQTSSAIANQSAETVAAINHAKVLSANIAQNITITSPKQANIAQVSGTGGSANESNIITNNYNLIVNIINNGTAGVSDRIVPNKFPANTNVNVNNSANLVLLNRSFIQAETIAYVNQTYPGFFANANNFIDVANAQATCSRDIGFILDSVAFDLRHDGNRQSVQSGVYYYNFSSANTQINEQIVQTGAAYNFIGSIIDEVVRAIPVTNTRQSVYTQNTTAATAATLTEANIVLQKISLINNIITNGPNVSQTKISLSGNVATISTNVSNAVKLIIANKDFIRAETIEFINATLFDPPYQSVYKQNTTAAPAASIAEANIVLRDIDLITDIITLGANAAPTKSPISYSTLSNNANVINAAKIILANRDYIIAEVNGYINQNWSNISNGTVAFFTVANSTPLVANTSLVALLEGETDTTIRANSIVSFHQPSYISALGYTFEYIGSGTNLQTALPYNGGFPIQENEVTEEKGGRVYFTSTDQQGDFRIGQELVFNRVDGTISGRTFTKALFSVMTPYILAVEG
jgi:hypothetical protein